jgi:hypothetical protein
MMARFYIVQKSNWQGDDWSVVAGPFANRNAAEVEKPEHECHYQQETGGIDLKSEKHARVVTRTWLRKHCGYPTTPEGEATLVFDIAMKGER